MILILKKKPVTRRYSKVFYSSVQDEEYCLFFDREQTDPFLKTPIETALSLLNSLRSRGFYIVESLWEAN